MPRGFTEQERVAVNERLVAAARRSLVERGLRATSVATLAREAGISKGAFYLFYDSKEALVGAVLGAEETALRAALDELMAAAKEQPATELVRFLFQIVERHPVMRLLSDPDEAALLFRSMSPEQLAAHMADDDTFFAGRCRRWQAAGKLSGDVDPDVFARIPRLALAIVQRRAFIGEAHYDALIELLTTSLGRTLSPP